MPPQSLAAFGSSVQVRRFCFWLSGCLQSQSRPETLHEPGKLVPPFPKGRRSTGDAGLSDGNVPDLISMLESTVMYLPVILVVVGVLGYAIIIYNELVRLRNENDRAWANIDVLLKQRHDEVPNLVETVKGYMHHEKETLLAVTEARAAAMSATTVGEKAQTDLLLTGALRGLF